MSQGNGSTKKFVIAVVAVVALVAAALGALSLYQSNKPTPPGPLGWDDEAFSAEIPAGRVENCDIGGGFWESVGISDVTPTSADSGSCTGWADIEGGGRIRVLINVGGSDSSTTSERRSLDEEGLDGWTEIMGTSGSTSRPWTTCTLESGNPAFTGYLSVNSGCDPLIPIARQFQNLQIQDDFARQDHGLFEFSSPEYLEVSPSPSRVTSEIYEIAAENAHASGETAPVVDSDFEGSTIEFDSFEDSGIRICADGTFTLGEGIYSYSNHFDVPHVSLIEPNGTTIDLTRSGSLHLQEGESVDLEFCNNNVFPNTVGTTVYVATYHTETLSPEDIDEAWEMTLPDEIMNRSGR